MANKIFISYRRDDSAGTAGRLHDRLAEKFGQDNLFIDVDNLPAGADFVEYLGKQIANCEIFLCTVGPNWLNAKDDDGRRRLDYSTPSCGGAQFKFRKGRGRPDAENKRNP